MTVLGPLRQPDFLTAFFAAYQSECGIAESYNRKPSSCGGDVEHY